MGVVRFVLNFTRLFLISLILSVIIATAAVAAGAFLMLRNLADDLPPLTGLRHVPSITTKIYDVNGVLLDELFAEELREKVVKLSDIPLITREAFIATEDQRFYQHYGLDPKRILGALYTDILAKQAVQGASTITQQLAKNLFLTRERTLARKLREMIMAFRLERTYSKNEILEMYLNEIFFGHRVFGIASATKYYFGKEVKDLDLAESAMLAGLPKSPNRFSPFNRTRPTAWKERQRVVLDLMLQQGYITRADHRAAVAKQVRFATGMPNSASHEAPYFLEYVKRQLLDRFGFKKVFAQGLKVHTTIDVRVQRLAEKHFLNAAVFSGRSVEAVPMFTGGMVVLNPTDGSIRAMIGGRDFQEQKFNRAVQARRQPGSTFKPFVYCTAFKNGLTPESRMSDTPYSRWDPGAQRWWSPGNFGGRYSGGMVTLADALRNSLNVVAVRVAETVGPDKIVDMAHRLGITSPLRRDLTIALGSSEVTLLEMASAYGSFANQGVHVKPRAITRVEDSQGRLIWDNEPVMHEAIDERLAWTMQQVLTNVVEHGTGVAAKVAGYQLAGKTGTSQDFIDAWFVGFMPDVVAAANVGYENRTSMGHGSTGGRLVAPIVGAFLREYVKLYPCRRTFPPPSGMTTVRLCAQTRKLAGPFCPSVVFQSVSAKSPPIPLCNVHRSPPGGSARQEGRDGSADDDHQDSGMASGGF